MDMIVSQFESFIVVGVVSAVVMTDTSPVVVILRFSLAIFTDWVWTVHELIPVFLVLQVIAACALRGSLWVIDIVDAFYVPVWVLLAFVGGQDEWFTV